MADDARLLLTTVTDGTAAAALGRDMVERRLAACASVIEGVRSIYRWRDKVADEREVMLMFKTTAERVTELREALLAAHPYEVPEVLVLEAALIPPAYRAWLQESTEAPPR